MIFNHPTERATIYKQRGSKNLYISYYNHLGKRKQISAKTDNFDLAKKKLDDLLTVQRLIKDGTLNISEQETTKTVDFCCFKTIQELESQKPQKTVYSAYIRHLNFIAEQFKGLSIKDLDRVKLKKLFIEPLSETQLRVRKTALKHLFEFASDSYYIDRSPDIPKGKIKGQQKFRSSITEDQYNFLKDRFELKSKEENDDRKRLNAELLYKMIILLYRTGMRLGEAKALRSCDISNGYGKNGQPQFYIEINKSKTGRRKILADNIVFNYCFKAENIFSDNEKLCFGINNKTVDFSGILQRDRNYNLDLYKDNGLDNFVIYELRHSFITRKIREKKDITLLAQHCGTSVKMIEKHYLDQIVSENYNIVYTLEDHFEDKIKLATLDIDPQQF